MAAGGPRLGSAGLRARRARAAIVRVPPVAAFARWHNHRDLGPGDRLLASYPKSGNTWLRFMLGNVCAGRTLGWDELGDVVPMVGRTDRASWCFADGARLVKTHDQPLPRYRVPTRRAVYVVRDGRDVAVSYYHHQRREGTATGSFSDWLARFLAGRVDRYGTWAQHVRSWSEVGEEGPTCLVLRYEAMLADPVEALASATSFLGIAAERPVLERVVEEHEASRMRAREAASSYLAGRSATGGSFVRSATAGGWRSTFTDRDEQRFLAAAGPTLRTLGYVT